MASKLSKARSTSRRHLSTICEYDYEPAVNTTMKPIVITLLLRILSLIGATLNTVGFITFFFWESLAPYRWPMIIGGILLIVLAEVAAHFYAKKLARELDQLEEDDDPNQSY